MVAERLSHCYRKRGNKNDCKGAGMSDYIVVPFFLCINVKLTIVSTCLILTSKMNWRKLSFAACLASFHKKCYKTQVCSAVTIPVLTYKIWLHILS